MRSVWGCSENYGVPPNDGVSIFSLDPRSALELKEEASADTESVSPSDEFAFAFGRLLIWILDGKTPHRIALRAVIATYKVRPDLLEHASLESIGKQFGCSRRNVSMLSCAFTDTFDFHLLNERNAIARRSYAESWAARHPTAPRIAHDNSPLSLANRYKSWETKLRAGGVDPYDDKHRLAFFADLRPLFAGLMKLREGVRPYVGRNCLVKKCKGGQKMPMGKNYRAKLRRDLPTPGEGISFRANGL